MINDIEDIFDNSFKKCSPKADDSVICFKGEDILIKLNNDNTIEYPKYSEIGIHEAYLFSIGEKRYFLSFSEPFNDYRYYHNTVLREAMPRESAFAGVTAFQLSNWYNNNVYCGRCGKKMKKSSTQRALVCSCSNVVYPKISPAVIVAIINNDKLCMTKYNRPNSHWALVAGFSEIGETLEQTVQREVMEETGLKVKNIKYYKSQPWGFTSTMLSGFYCEVDGDDTIKIDNNELKDGRWFTRDEITFGDNGLSLTREMIENFRKNII